MTAFKKTLMLFLLRSYLLLVVFTCKWKTYNFSILKNAMKQKNPILLSCWHENLVYFSCFFRFWKKKVHVISSTHPDSQILAKILESWGFELIKGSSTRGWLSVLKKLLSVFKTKNSIVAITHDGPKGPPKKSKPGALKAAIQNDVSIIGMRGEASNFWRANSWDKTLIPKPFSTIKIFFYPMYDGDDNEESFDEYLNTNEERTVAC